jgi:hypothetical protein
MVNQQSSNVIPFGARKSHPTSAMHEDAAIILQACRDCLIDRVMAVFTRHVGRANDELLAMTDQPIDQESRQLCFDAMSFLANRAPILLRHFHEAYIGVFEATLSRLDTDHSRSLPRLPDELKLVDEEDFELDLAMTKLTTRAAFNCAQSLVALDHRLAVLLQVPRIVQDDNPLHPGLIYKAMFQALTEMGARRQLAIFLLQSFERQTAGELPGIYGEVDRHLVEAGILPSIPVSTPESGTPSVRLHEAETPASRPAPTTPTDDVFGQLLRSLQALASAAAAPASGVGVSVPMSAAPTLPAAPQTFGREQLLQALSDLQRGPLNPGIMPGLGASRFDPWTGNAVAQLRATPMASWSAPVDVMTMDIVAMLFEVIFNDPDLPAAVRAEIAKLQIPVLKVALLDKGFFSDRKHPARRLLDVIAQAGLGRGEQDGRRLLEKIRAVIAAVLDGFESDIGVFAAQVEALESFLADEGTGALDKINTGLVKDLARRERQELAAGRVAAEIERRVTRADVSGLIVDFLERGWNLVLSDVFVRQGDSDPEWSESLHLMDELIWSVEPKTSTADRERLIGLLPSLLKGLRSGLARLDLEDAWSEFFSTLIQRHVAALRREAATTTVSPAPPPAPDPSATDARVERPPALKSVSLSSGSTQTIQDRHLKLVKALEVGAWIEFQTARGSRNTLYLSWVSDFKGVYLFTNRQGENAMTLAATSLAEHLRKGRARLLSQNPLTERAVAQVIERVQPPGA